MRLNKLLISKVMAYTPAFVRQTAKKVLPKSTVRALVARLTTDPALRTRQLARILSQPRSIFPTIETGLWSPYSDHAVETLLRVLEDPSANEMRRIHALWALARWSVSVQDYKQALSYFYALRRLLPDSSLTIGFQLLELEALLSEGQVSEAQFAAHALQKVRGDEPELLYAMANVAKAQGAGHTSAHLDTINRALAVGGLAPLALRDPNGSLALGNIHAPTAIPEPDCSRAKVSVIVPAYNAAETIGTALEGILAQTWSNLEVLVVNDASTDNTAEIVRSFALRDERVRQLAHPRNSGAYAARNTGLAHATGEFVTVHDADDWSHPQKIAIQVNDSLQKATALNATSGIRVSDDLKFLTQPNDGRIVVFNTSSVLYRRADLARLGGWDAVRFGGDAELYVRAQKYYGQPCKRLVKATPLTFILSSSGSLTQNSATGKHTFYYGARREYREAYDYWHSTTDSLPLPEHGRAFPVPRIFCSRDTSAREYDILFVSDLSLPGGTTSSNINMWQAAAESGLKQAVLHWPRADHVHLPSQSKLRKLIHEQLIDVIVPGEKVKCDLVVVNHPNLLMTLPNILPQVECGACVVIFNQAPVTRHDSGRVAYDTQQVLDNAQRAFGVRPQAAPLSPLIRRILGSSQLAIEFTPIDWTPLINCSQWRRDRVPERTPSRRPVIGRHGRDHHEKWPEDVESIVAAYGVDGPVDVRILGGAGHAISRLGRKPRNWKVLPFNQVDVASFLAELDFFVYFPHRDLIEAFGRAPMEAMATGVPVILPHHFEETFQDAAIYATPSEVLGIIERLWNNEAEYNARVERGIAYVERVCSAQGFSSRVRPYMSSL
ncbi:glycosyltransferase [Microvirga sp. M2]|uniref:glycosyltransferase n=1 Tax=Microvirga sp. M2 TaxID=3073270 RepID=UPI0039C0B996